MSLPLSSLFYLLDIAGPQNLPVNLLTLLLGSLLLSFLPPIAIYSILIGYHLAIFSSNALYSFFSIILLTCATIYIYLGLLLATIILLAYTYENEQTRLLLEKGYKIHKEDEEKTRSLLTKYHIIMSEEQKITGSTYNRHIYYTKDNIIRIKNFWYIFLQTLFLHPIYPLFYGNTKLTFILISFQILINYFLSFLFSNFDIYILQQQFITNITLHLISPEEYINSNLLIVSTILLLSTHILHRYLFKKYILRDIYTKLL